ncbi:MAG: hypothetical protein AAGA56_03750 [Myxococcota bacterium]
MFKRPAALLALALAATAASACTTKAHRAEPTSLEVSLPAKPAGPRLDADPKTYHRTVMSRPYHIAKKYRSMMGPSSLQKVELFESEEPELLWITGYQAVVMDKSGEQQVSQEFMCHSNLDAKPNEYWESFNSNASLSGRLFTLSQGQQRVKFPRGYGIPIMSTHRLDLATQVLNLNLDDANLNVRHKVTIDFVREKEVRGQMVPLYQAAVQGFKSLEGKSANYGYSSAEGAAGESHSDEGHEGCSVGLPAVAGDQPDEDAFGQKFTGHWIVKPGREVNKSLVTEFLQLQFDTTIHYIAVHLHPFAESLELIDRTTGQSVFKAKATQAEGKIGLKHIEHFESVEGLRIYKDHEYELVSVYNNTTKEDQDSMAVMYLYVKDVNFNRPTDEVIAKLKEKAKTPEAEPPAKAKM